MQYDRALSELEVEPFLKRKLPGRLRRDVKATVKGVERKLTGAIGFAAQKGDYCFVGPGKIEKTEGPAVNKVVRHGARLTCKVSGPARPSAGEKLATVGSPALEFVEFSGLRGDYLLSA